MSFSDNLSDYDVSNVETAIDSTIKIMWEKLDGKIYPVFGFMATHSGELYFALINLLEDKYENGEKMDMAAVAVNQDTRWWFIVVSISPGEDNILVNLKYISREDSNKRIIMALYSNGPNSELNMRILEVDDNNVINELGRHVMSMDIIHYIESGIIFGMN